jgi:dTDP-4-dehydrorhamnose reductase
MLGHQLFRGLSTMHEVRVTLRRPLSDYAALALFTRDNAYGGIDVRSSGSLVEVFDHFRPHAVCNAVGIVKQRASAADPIASIQVNALFPHRLAQLAAEAKARVLQISTDCVFSGTRGGYTEEDLPDPVDLYGRTKLLGELEQTGCVTLRTSIIGLELQRRQGLVEWALAQRGSISGFRRARFSGLTTPELTRVCDALLSRHVDLEGIWHVASHPISKYNLLVELFGHLGRRDVQVVPEDSFVCDRTLVADRFEQATGYRCPHWSAMLGELAMLIRARKRLGA